MDDIPITIPAKPTRFIDKLRQFIRSQNKAYKTEQTYVHWAKRFIRFHKKKHPKEMGADEIEQFLDHLAVHQHASKNTQKTALNALVFLYKQFLQIELRELKYNYAHKPTPVPDVFSHNEANAVMDRLTEPYLLMAQLMYGSGLRISDCIRLRVKEQILYVDQVHKHDLANGLGEVYLPNALEKKYPSAATSAAWQYLFPSSRIARDSRSGVKRRHHVHESFLQCAVKNGNEKCANFQTGWLSYISPFFFYTFA